MKRSNLNVVMERSTRRGEKEKNLRQQGNRSQASGREQARTLPSSNSFMVLEGKEEKRGEKLKSTEGATGSIQNDKETGHLATPESF